MNPRKPPIASGLLFAFDLGSSRVPLGVPFYGGAVQYWGPKRDPNLENFRVGSFR